MGLELAFDTLELRSICESPTKAKRKLGDLASRDLRHRLADMRAAESASTLIEMGWASESGTRGSPSLRISLTGTMYVICQPNHGRLPLLKGRVDWTHVTRLRVTSIGK